MSISQSLVYFDGCKPWYGSTICLSGPNNRYLQTIKKYMERVLKYCRDLILEREYLFTSDADSTDKMKSPYLIPKVGIGKTSLKYVKVMIKHSKKHDHQHDDFYGNNEENEDSDHNEANHDEGLIGESESHVKRIMDQICGKPVKENIEFYGDNDITLGAFLRKTCDEANEKWYHCKEKHYRHVTHFYHGDGYVEITVSIKNPSLAQLKFDDKENDKSHG